MAIIQPPARAQLLGYGVRAPRPQVNQGVVHALHSTQLRIACANPASSAGGVNPTVVFTGDSTSQLAGNDTFNEMETISGLIQRRLRRQNPGVAAWTFIDRGIGGTTWNALAGTPNFAGGVIAPSWYTSTGQPWISSYIAPTSGAVPDANAPDLVVICLGTNDLNAVAFGDIRVALNHFANPALFPVMPDIWLCTTTGRTTDLAASTQTQIDGVQLAAAASRNVAMQGAAAILGSTYTKHIGLLDFGRMDAISRLGYDPARQVLTDVPAFRNLTGQSVGLAAAPLAFAECDGDFDYQVTFPSPQAGTILNNGGLRFVVGAALSRGQSESYVQLTRNSTLVAANIVAGTVSNLANSTLGSGALVVRIIAQQGEMIVFCQGTRIMDTSAVPGSVARGIGRFTPRIFYNVAPPSPVTATVDFFRAGRRMGYAPTIREIEAWNRDGAGIYGAGKVNHPTSFHVAETVRAVLDAQNFCVTA